MIYLIFSLAIEFVGIFLLQSATFNVFVSVFVVHVLEFLQVTLGTVFPRFVFGDVCWAAIMNFNVAKLIFF